MGGRRGCSDVVVTVDGGAVFNQKSVGIGCAELAGTDAKLAVDERSQLN